MTGAGKSLWTSDAAARATGGRATCKFAVTGVSIDTRTIAKGELFVALKDVRDGHDYVAQALDKGAGAALVSRVPEGVAEDAPLLIVDEVLPALEALGVAARARTGARVVAVTGSVGKTSTKEMLRAVLSRQGRTHAAEASYNNHWGVPLTLARMPGDAEYAVIEIGMNHPGEIAPLARMARPHVAMITTVAPAHMEAFEDLNGIAREKAAVFEGLEPGGTAIFNGDLGAEVTATIEAAAGARGWPVFRFGETEGCAYRLRDVRLTDEATVVQADLPSGAQLFKLATLGRHFAANALGVLAVAEALGADVTLAARDLVLWQPPAGRGAREAVMIDEGTGAELGLIDDAFNANPTSMAAALEVLAAATPGTPAKGHRGGRRIAILGDMLELGASEVEDHAELAGLDWMRGIDMVHCVGPRMRYLHEVLDPAQRGEWVETAPEMVAMAHRLVHAGDIVLVKGSKGSKVSLVVDAIRKMGQAAATEKGNE